MSDLIKDVLMGKLFGSGTGSGGSSGGGGTGGVSAGVQPKEVNFYDYDGTCVYAYSVAEAQALSALPAGPEHPGLVFQGWNWSLEGVKGLTRAMNIGAMYTTDDGTTRLYITLQEGRTSPMLGVGVNGTVTVDWGDGTEPDVLTGTSVSTTQWTPNHAYAAPGNYVIRLTVDGEMAFTGISSAGQYACILRYSTSADNRNQVYQSALKRLEIGDNVTKIHTCAFKGCYSLAFVTIPEIVEFAGETTFEYCRSLVFVTIPKGSTFIGTSTFRYCTSLKTVAFPENVTNISTSFYYCYSLASVTIPDSIKSLSSAMFYDCCSLAFAPIPKNVTSLGSNTFNGCVALTSATIAESVTSLGSNAFDGCEGMAFVDFTACSTVPTLENAYVFRDIPADCEIRVPAALYDEWIAATNWATYASYIKAY